MSLAAKIRRAPLRATTGAFILNSGLSKLKADEEAAGQLHGMASNAYPFLAKVDPKIFVKVLAIGEITVGGLLLTPIVPAGLAGIALTGFAGGLLGVYASTPGARQPGSILPSQQGTPLAKDIWLAGVGMALTFDAALNESPITDDASHLLHRD